MLLPELVKQKSLNVIKIRNQILKILNFAKTKNSFMISCRRISREIALLKQEKSKITKELKIFLQNNEILKQEAFHNKVMDFQMQLLKARD